MNNREEMNFVIEATEAESSLAKTLKTKNSQKSSVRKSYTGNLNETKSSLSVQESFKGFGNFAASEVQKPNIAHRMTY